MVGDACDDNQPKVLEVRSIKGDGVLLLIENPCPYEVGCPGNSDVGRNWLIGHVPGESPVSILDNVAFSVHAS